MRTSTAATKFLNNLLQNNFVISFEEIPSNAFGRMKKKKNLECISSNASSAPQLLPPTLEKNLLPNKFLKVFPTINFRVSSAKSKSLLKQSCLKESFAILEATLFEKHLVQIKTSGRELLCLA